MKTFARVFLAFCLPALLLPLSLSGKQVTLSGIIKDKTNGETLASVYVFLQNVSEKSEVKGSFSNISGFYSLTVPDGKYYLKISLMGYRTIEDTLFLTSNYTYHVDMEPNPILTKEVTVSAQREDYNVSSVETGKMSMTVEAIKSIPALMGEADVIKAVQLLPGVQSGGEGNSGFYVRGGGADQNLVLLDEATVYNASHLFGFFSVFNANAVKNVDIIKSGMPAQYGQRMSSILDVHQKEGNMKKFEGQGGIGLIFANLTIQGPIKKDKASFIISGRRTYIDWLIQPFLSKNSPMKGTRFYFYDLNAKFNIILNDKHRLFVGGYYGNDVYGFKSNGGGMNAQMHWGNAAASLRWNYIINAQLFLNTSATFSDYDFGTDMKMSVYGFKLKSGVRDYALKSELTYLPAIPHRFTFGVHYIFHRFNPNTYEIAAGEQTQFAMPVATNYYAHELGIYANDEFDITRWLKINAGLRYSHFEHIGAFTRYVQDNTGHVVDSIYYKPGKPVSRHNGLEPRLSARFLLNKQVSIKTSYTLNYQYLHQISMSTVSLPTDVWMPSTDLVYPQTAHQVSLGVYYNFHDNMFETYIDAYYKKMNHLAEYKDGLDLSNVTMNPDQLYTFGQGQSYGIEFFIKKLRGRFIGFAGYTLAYTTRQFDALNGGKPFFARYDRRHDVSISLTYEIIKHKLSASAVWVYSTGNTMTVPTGLYFYAGTIITEYSDRNAYRMPPYHRLDFSIDWTIVKKKRFETGLNLSVYNVYNRQNPFFIYIQTETVLNPQEKEFSLNMQGYQMSLFPILPSITWNFKF
ncbi:MAG: TonB-dependent receptor [Bacteroidales bacterium]|nr:TonB-dependent receptor [Bacteroidales bacterium]